jgi:hypothetical protein
MAVRAKALLEQAGVARRLVALAILLSIAAFVPASAQQSGRRVALVIGNGAYRSVERLANPSNDARLVATTLQVAGFTLVGGGAQLELDKPEFDQMVQQFGKALQGADVALFYYSGHGMQVQGSNWLVPVDANPTGPKDLDFQMIDANLVLRQMEDAGTKLNLVILDACRNNPFALRGVRASGGGLAEMHAPEGTLISYATQPGNVAADGDTADSPYTTALVDAIRQPGVDVFHIFNQVGLMVKQETAGAQQPWLASSPISGNFYFFNGPVKVQPPAAMDAEAVFWQSISASQNPADFGAYLRRFPGGDFSELAQNRLAALTASAVSSPAADTSSPSVSFRAPSPTGDCNLPKRQPGGIPGNGKGWIYLGKVTDCGAAGWLGSPHVSVDSPVGLGGHSFTVVGDSWLRGLAVLPAGASSKGWRAGQPTVSVAANRSTVFILRTELYEATDGGYALWGLVGP